MKRRFTFIKIIAVFLLMAVAFLGWRQWSRHKLHAAVEETHRQLRAEGFRTELGDFNLTPSRELQHRADLIAKTAATLRSQHTFQELQLMEWITPQAARRTTSQPFIPTRGVPSAGVQLALFLERYSNDHAVAETPLPGRGERTSALDNLWELLAIELRSSGQELDCAAQSIAEGDFRFAVTSKQAGFQAASPTDINQFAQALNVRTALAIHHNCFNEAFTNFLALTYLATHWRTEPVEHSYRVKYFCVELAFLSLWEGLQADAWSDEQLLLLQQAWERADFFEGLPDTVALEGAGMIQYCREAREGKFGWRSVRGQLADGFRHSVTNGFRTIRQLTSAYQQFAAYRSTGSYEDEKNLMLYYREREKEMRQALACNLGANAPDSRRNQHNNVSDRSDIAGADINERSEVGFVHGR